MHLLKTYLFLALVLTFASGSSHAQHADATKAVKVKKNVIQGSAGFLIYTAGVQLNYERQLLEFAENSLSGLRANVGIGYWGVTAGYGGPYQHISLGLLSGHENNHFEFTLGISRLNNTAGGNDNNHGQSPVSSDSSKDISFSPIGTMGYRYQKAGGFFVFRCGIAYPPMPYVGLGVAF